MLLSYLLRNWYFRLKIRVHTYVVLQQILYHLVGLLLVGNTVIVENHGFLIVRFRENTLNYIFMAITFFFGFTYTYFKKTRTLKIH